MAITNFTSSWYSPPATQRITLTTKTAAINITDPIVYTYYCDTSLSSPSGSEIKQPGEESLFYCVYNTVGDRTARVTASAEGLSNSASLVISVVSAPTSGFKSVSLTPSKTTVDYGKNDVTLHATAISASAGSSSTCYLSPGELNGDFNQIPTQQSIDENIARSFWRDTKTWPSDIDSFVDIPSNLTENTTFNLFCYCDTCGSKPENLWIDKVNIAVNTDPPSINFLINEQVGSFQIDDSANLNLRWAASGNYLDPPVLDISSSGESTLPNGSTSKIIDHSELTVGTNVLKIGYRSSVTQSVVWSEPVTVVVSQSLPYPIVRLSFSDDSDQKSVDQGGQVGVEWNITTSEGGEVNSTDYSCTWKNMTGGTNLPQPIGSLNSGTVENITKSGEITLTCWILNHEETTTAKDSIKVLINSALVFGKNSKFQGVVFSEGTITINSNSELKGSFVGKDFDMTSMSNINIFYDYNLDEGWPPGFRYLKMPSPKEIGNR